MKMQTNNVVGDAVRVMRARRNMSQEMLAQASGVSRVVISRIETGESDPQMSTFIKLCKAANHDIFVQDIEEVFEDDDIDEF